MNLFAESKFCHWKVIQQTSKKSRKGFAQRMCCPAFWDFTAHQNRAGLERWVISKTGGFYLQYWELLGKREGIRIEMMEMIWNDGNVN